MMSDLSLFALALGKAALYTGIGPAVLFVYAAEKLVSAFGVPAKVVSAMGLYNFRAQFTAKILSGEKRHTIRRLW